jgi:hypothetical protein
VVKREKCTEGKISKEVLIVLLCGNIVGESDVADDLEEGSENNAARKRTFL